MTEVQQRKIFGKNLKHWLTVRGVKQVELAEKLGVSEGTVSQWISGRSMPKMGKVQRITNILDIDMTDLYDDKKSTNEDEDMDEFRRRMHDKYGVLFDIADIATPDERKKLEEVAKIIVHHDDSID